MVITNALRVVDHQMKTNYGQPDCQNSVGSKGWFSIQQDYCKKEGLKCAYRQDHCHGFTASISANLLFLMKFYNN